MGESGRKNTDRGYTHEEIKKILEVADLRMKSVILLMASTGMRIGAVTELKLKHLKEINKDKEKIYFTRLPYMRNLKKSIILFVVLNVLL